MSRYHNYSNSLYHRKFKIELNLNDNECLRCSTAAVGYLGFPLPVLCNADIATIFYIK